MNGSPNIHILHVTIHSGILSTYPAVNLLAYVLYTDTRDLRYRVFLNGDFLLLLAILVNIIYIYM